MALKINKNLTAKDGSVIASGSIVKFDTNFPRTGDFIRFYIGIYRDSEAFDSGKSPVLCTEIDQYQEINLPLSQEEYNALTPITIHEKLKAYLEGIIGQGVIEII
jgi:hypothetical protein